MMRILAIAALFVALGACNANDAAEGNPWYSQGDANYDALRRADDACRAKGGTFHLKPGGDPTHLGDYECAPKGAH